jgi:hypothetical protein
VAGNTIKALGRLGNASPAMVGMAGDDEVRATTPASHHEKRAARMRLVGGRLSSVGLFVHLSNQPQWAACV